MLDKIERNGIEKHLADSIATDIWQIVLHHEDDLSDGFNYYRPVNETRDDIKSEIIDVLTERLGI